MENEIVRKTTSLTLIAIMVAGGLTFAVPGVIPAAHADGALYVSAESDMFENTFVGAQVIEVIVNDGQYRDDNGSCRLTGGGSEPIVTIDDNELKMQCAQSGNWYAYFVEKESAMAAQGLGLFHFGDDTFMDTDAPYFVKDSDTNVLSESPSGIEGELRIYAFDFTEGSTVDVELENSADTETVTLAYDTVEDYAELMLDRTKYPQMAHVHITITDTWLNIDPTSEDVWTFNTVTGEASYRDDNDDPDSIAYDSTDHTFYKLQDHDDLMCDDNCTLLITPDKQNKGDVVHPVSNADRKLMDDAFTVRFEEGAPNSGVFTNGDDDDDAANVMTTASAQRGTTATIDYNDTPMDIVAGNSFATIDMDAGGDVWSSGEEIPVIIVDDDANRNSASDEDMEVSNPDMIIPTLVTGSPLTLDEDSVYSTSTNIVTGTSTSIKSSASESTNTEDFSMRGLVNTGSGTGTLIIQYDNQDLNTLDHGDGFKGFSYFNYHFESIIDDDSANVVLTTAPDIKPVKDVAEDCMMTSLDDTLDCLVGDGVMTQSERDDILDFDEIPNYDDSTDVIMKFDGECMVELASGSSSDYVNIDDALAATNTCDGGKDITLLITANFKDEDMAPIVADFMSFGYIDDGVQGHERVANQIIRIEAEETDDGSGVFEGGLEYVMVNQLNILDPDTYEIDPITDVPTFIVIEDLTDEDSPKVTYLDVGADGVATQVSDQESAPSHSGVVSLDSNRYKIADTVVITLEDADLNVDSELIDIYTVVDHKIGVCDDDRDTPRVDEMKPETFGQVGEVLVWDATACMNDEGEVVQDEITETFGSLGRLLDVTFDDSLWATGSCNLSGDTGLDSTGFTLVETGVATGVFVGDFQIPADWCDGGDAESTTGLDIEVNYLDFRDAAGEIIEVGDSAAVGASTGSVAFDRTVYPVPFGIPENFGVTSEGSPSKSKGESFFPIHSSGLGDGDGLWYLSGGDLTIHVRVSDPDYDVSASGQDAISEDNPVVTVSVSRGSYHEVVAEVGSHDNPIQEIAPDAGVFEADITVRFDSGPENDCPRITDDVQGCILQGDILEVVYEDPVDASGDSNTVTDSATFDLRNGVLQSDKNSYVIGTDMILTLIEPDFDLDNDQAETYDLDLIEWDSDAATVTMGNRGGNAAAFDPEPTDFRETGDSTGIFQTIIEIPEALDGDRLNRGEVITLEYTDWGPAGADYVGEEDEDVTLQIVTSDFGSTIELDQKVYTWTDKVYITVVAPDHNYDSDLVDEIGDSETDPLKVSTRGHDLDEYKLVETGTDTGIFTGEVILTGFKAHDADGDGNTGDARGITVGSGPTSGLLETGNDDGLSVSYEYTEDVTIVASALIRWNIGEVQWLESSYPATGAGIVRVIDPDMNLNPEAVDNFEVNVWSDSDAGGIDLTVTETNEATGIFEGTVDFQIETESSGHRLRAAEGDTVTAEYEDRTLPDPYNTIDDLDITATTLIGTVVPPLERAPATNLRAVDSFGNSLDTVSVDQQVQLMADLMNGQDRNQAFAYLVQVQDANGVVVSLAWITGTLTPGQTFSPAGSWTPDMAGTYTATAFVWESLDNPTALSPPVSTTITVE